MLIVGGAHYLPYISPKSPLHLPYISTYPLYLPHVSIVLLSTHSRVNASSTRQSRARCAA